MQLNIFFIDLIVYMVGGQVIYVVINCSIDSVVVKVLYFDVDGEIIFVEEMVIDVEGNYGFVFNFYLNGFDCIWIVIDSVVVCNQGFFNEYFIFYCFDWLVYEIIVLFEQFVELNFEDIFIYEIEIVVCNVCGVVVFINGCFDIEVGIRDGCFS